MANKKGTGLVFIIVATLISTNLDVYGHSGGTNSEGCHAGSKPYHCHNSGKARTVSKSSKSALHEDHYNANFCEFVGGRTEVRHLYRHPSGNSYVRVDCETDTVVYEGGLDKRSSLDSVQQVLFFSYLTQKKPVVVIYDTDGRIGKFEYRIMKACRLAGVKFVTSSINNSVE